jgi:hypothetical protein
MSMVDVRDAFTAALGSNGTLLGATMTCQNGGALQTLTFTVQLANGTTSIVTEQVTAAVDHVVHAANMANDFVTKQLKVAPPVATTVNIATLDGLSSPPTTA